MAPVFETPVLNADGTLKDAEDMEFEFSPTKPGWPSSTSKDCSLLPTRVSGPSRPARHSNQARFRAALTREHQASDEEDAELAAEVEKVVGRQQITVKSNKVGKEDSNSSASKQTDSSEAPACFTQKICVSTPSVPWAAKEFCVNQ